MLRQLRIDHLARQFNSLPFLLTTLLLPSLRLLKKIPHRAGILRQRPIMRVTPSTH